MQMLLPDWPAPAKVKACVTLREGGVSQGGYSHLNLATHVGDDPKAVAENRARLRAVLPAEPAWLTQVHGTAVATFPIEGAPQADAAVAHVPLQICAILTADCLPVLFCDVDAKAVAAAHAGWRGLAAGVLENTLAKMEVSPGNVMAWLGPAISQAAFEVGEEVREAFVAPHPEDARAFIAGQQPGKWQADLYALARLRLARAGVKQVFGGGACTYQETSRFFSYRRAAESGRFASLIWLSD